MWCSKRIWLGALCACMVSSVAVAQPQRRPSRMPSRRGGRRKLNEERAKATALVYSQLYAVPEEILAGKAKEWLATHAKAIDGVPMSKRHQGRLREVFSASLAVRTGRLDAGEWGKRLYGEGTVAREVYDALVRALAGDAKALPGLINVVPAEERIGAGWVFMAYGLRGAAGKLAVAPESLAVPILTFAGGPFGFPVSPEVKQEIREMPRVIRVSQTTQKPIADAILAAKGGAAWQTYLDSLLIHLHVHLGSQTRYRTRPLARLMLSLCKDPKRRYNYFQEMKGLVPEMEVEVGNAYYEHRRKGKGGARSTLILAGRKREQGAHAEAAALYREAEEGLAGTSRRKAWQGLYATLAEAPKKGVVLKPTWVEEVARRKQAAAGNDPTAVLALADALARTGQQEEAVRSWRSVLASASAPADMRVVAWDALAEAVPGDAWSSVKERPEVFLSKIAVSRSGEVLQYAILEGDFAGAATWLAVLNKQYPNPGNQAREAVLWCAAGELGKAEALLVIPPQDPKHALRVLESFVRIDQAWRGHGKELPAASRKTLREKLPPGTCWPVAAQYGLRILADPVLRRDQKTVKAWVDVLVRLPSGVNAGNEKRAHQLSQAVLGWAREVPPVATDLLMHAQMVLGRIRDGDMVRAECVTDVVVGALETLSAKKIPEKAVSNRFTTFTRALPRSNIPERHLATLRAAVLRTYPNLISQFPKPKGG